MNRKDVLVYLNGLLQFTTDYEFKDADTLIFKMPLNPIGCLTPDKVTIVEQGTIIKEIITKTENNIFKINLKEVQNG